MRLCYTEKDFIVPLDLKRCFMSLFLSTFFHFPYSLYNFHNLKIAGVLGYINVDYLKKYQCELQLKRLLENHHRDLHDPMNTQ